MKSALKGFSIGAFWLFGALFAGALHAQPAAVEPSYTYITRSGDTLIGLGRRLLVEPLAWREVAEFNRLKDPNRIATGTELRFPLSLLRSEGLTAKVEQVNGDVRSTGGAAAAALRGGEALAEGAALQTGADGSAVLRLADGSLLRLAAGSQLQIDRARRYPDIDHVDSGVKLEQGRVEVKVPKARDGKPGFEVRTPQGVLGVRGTEFRVSALAERQITGGEVLEGAVHAAGGEGATGGRLLGAGFGTLIDNSGRVEEPTPLLPAPDLGAMPSLQERLILRFPVQAMSGATGFRGQIGRDEQMLEVLADNLAQGPELRFTNLEDGNYVLRVRAIDARGLEGLDAKLNFRLKARPEPPVQMAPPPRGVTRGTRVSLAWAANPQAETYRLQVAADEGFTNILRELPAVADTRAEIDDLPPGDYFWRLASVRAGNDQGPWGAARVFVLRPLPPTPAPPAVGDKTVRFDWQGEPGQTFEFQLASDPEFKNLVIERRLDSPGIEIPRPEGGTYHMRVRARDADGFQGPYTTPQRFEIIDCATAGDGSCLKTGTGGYLITR